MKLLYITPDFPGLKECLFDGAAFPYGLPSFNEMVMKLLKDGNYIDFILFSNDKSIQDLNIKAPWLSNSEVKHIIKYKSANEGRLHYYKRVIKIIRQIIRDNDYDFVYGQGVVGVFANIAANKEKVPCGLRIYGTFMWKSIQKKGKIKTLLKNPLETIGYLLKKKFLIITNDGSGGDNVVKTIYKNRPVPYEFHYLVNGVDRERSKKTKPYSYDKTKPFIFYCARFDEWKRQDRIINVLKLLKKRGIIINAYFAGLKHGPMHDSYYKKICQMVKKNRLEMQVHFMGNVSYEEINYMNNKALASLCLHDTCNMTNVFHESMASGSLLIVKSDGEVDKLIKDGINGYLVGNDDSKIVDILINLLNNNVDTASIRKNAIKTSKEKIFSWDNRLEFEEELIKKHAKKK